MSHQTSHRLSQYATLAHHRPVVTGSLVAAAVASPAVAGLEIWTVGHDLGNGNITLTATATNFNTNYKINFTQSGNNFHVFNGPVSFITGDFTYAPAMWTGNVSFGSDALDGQASANGVSAHAWKLASGFNYLDRNIGASDVDPHALGIRFDAGEGDYYYGWVEVTKAAGSVTIERWALETTVNTAAQYGMSGGGGGGGGAVPGLGCLAALACGAAGMRRSRQRVA